MSKIVQIPKFLHYIWNAYRIVMFCPILMFFFFEFIMLTNFLYLLWFLRETQWKGTSKYLIVKFKFSYFSSSFNAVFGKIINFMGE